MKIAIPFHEFYLPLIANANIVVAGNQSIEIIRTNEDECTRLLLANSVDVALLSPVGYGRGVVTSDLRIIPTNVCLLRNWTNVGSIFFAQNLREITRIASPNPADFLVKAAMIILDEQYGISAPIEKQNGEPAELLREFPTIISWNNASESGRGLDISEEWEVAFGFPLPLAMWVCRSEFSLDLEAAGDTEGAQLKSLTQLFAADGLPEKEERTETMPVGDADLRHGVIDWKWTAEFEDALNQTLQLLYYRQLVREIPAVKLVGRD